MLKILRAAETFFSNPLVGVLIGLIAACVMTVIAWKMNQNWANMLLIVAWLGLIALVVRAVSEQPAIPRLLWIILSASIAGLILYYTLWTSKAIQAHQAEESSVAPPPAVSMVVPAPNEPFVVTGLAAIPAIESEDPMASSWWAVYEMGHKKFRSPVTNLISIAFTSMRPGTLIISSYSIEVRTEMAEWKKMTRLPTSPGATFFNASRMRKTDQFKKSFRFEFPAIFDRIITGKKIQPYDPIKGWLFLEAPKEYVGKQRLEWRMRITDITNVEFVQTFNQQPTQNEGYEAMSYSGLIKQGTQDISKTTPVLYSEQHWR